MTAGDGEQALALLQEPEGAQIAILDWMMPRMSGLEICRSIRQQQELRYIYLILLTGRDKDQDMVTGMEAGADDYLTKPLNVNELNVRMTAAKRVMELQNELLAARETAAAHAREVEALNRSLEGFSYALSKDILQSLQTIAGSAKAIQDLVCAKPDEQCYRYTRKIYERAKALGEIVGMMQAFLKPARNELTREKVDLSAIAAAIADQLRATHPGRRATFRIAGEVEAEGDPDQLWVMMDNLLENAWRFTGQVEEAVIEFGFSDAGGKRTYFVRDNGCGFSPEEAGKLFMPFFRFSGAGETEAGGIGLATVERIVRVHGGRVWAEGEKGKGATFYFTLPTRHRR